MTRDAPRDSLDDRLDRYLSGELSGPEQRELAQAALDDPALFDTLTSTALLKEAAHDYDPAALLNAGGRRRRTPRPLVLVLGGAIAAAAVIGIVMIKRTLPNVSDVHPSQTTSARANPAPDARRLAAPPVFLTARADSPIGSSTVFRSTEARSRLPKSAGTVLSVEGGDIDVDLGSLDGIVNGSTLRLFPQSGREPVATLVASSVFRERSRGRAPSGSTPQAGDRVEISRPDHVSALLQHADALAAAGDVPAAQHAAELAVSEASLPDAPTDLRRRALAVLGTVEHRGEALEAAARHLRLAVDEFEATPVARDRERADVLSELGGVLIERHEYVDAERVLRLAQPSAAGRNAVRIANNLAALAALRGDFAAAALLYRSAIDLAGASPDLESDRRIIRNNLERVQAPQ